MISKYINALAVAVLSASVIACSSSSGSSSAGTSVSLSAAPSPANAAAMPAGAKTFNNDMGDSITLSKAYLVISSATIETTCGASFSAALDGLLDLLLPQANAHTTTTPTSTGVPVVIDLLAVDGGPIGLGSVSPPAGDYCGVDIDMLAADADASNLPTGAGEPDMIGKTLFIEGSYTLFGGGSGVISMSTGSTLINRELLLFFPVMISKNNLNGSIGIAINYDTWFDAVDLATLETETATVTNPGDTNVSQVLQNITNSIHQL